MIESGRAKYTYSKMHGVCCTLGHQLLGMQPPLLVDEHRLTRADVAHQLERQHVERHALRGQHPLRSLAPYRAGRAPAAGCRSGSRKPRMPWPMTMRDDGVAAATAPVDGVQRRENVAGA